MRFFKDHATCQCEECKGARATKDSISASGFFTSEQIGPRQSFTPEGFLLCEAVPIARIGTQDYLAEELPDIEDQDGIVIVERDAEVVFSPETISSFQGKPVTIGHPNDGVNPSNWSVLAKGTAHNVRRGEGAQSDLLLADLLITDKGAINDITSKRLREISCGYDSDYEQIAPGRARQVTIVGNHVALVEHARCGPVCSVADGIDKSLGGISMAAKKGATSFADKMRKLFMARDSEGFEKALEEVNDEGSGMEGGAPVIHVHIPGAPETPKVEPTRDEPTDDPMAKVCTAVEALTQVVTQIGERVAKLETPATSDDDPSADPAPETDDEDPEPEKKPAKTGDSAAFKIEFQDAKARAEILAPGVALPTFDAKAEVKTTRDSLCVLRRRALRGALKGDNAALVKTVVGDEDVSKMPCESAKMAFLAASELVKQKNLRAPVRTGDAATEQPKDLNQIHADFWANRK